MFVVNISAMAEMKSTTASTVVHILSPTEYKKPGIPVIASVIDTSQSQFLSHSYNDEREPHSSGGPGGVYQSSSNHNHATLASEYNEPPL